MKDHLNDRISVCWYHPGFSESRYPPGQTKSEACTLICLLLAQRISETKLNVQSVEECPEFNILMVESMIEGNNTHAWILGKGLISHPYLNTVEALEYGGDNLSTLKEWVLLFDSHAHNTSKNMSYGLVVAQTSIDNLKVLCDWYIDAVLHSCYKTHADQYELAFIYENENATRHTRSCNCYRW